MSIEHALSRAKDRRPSGRLAWRVKEFCEAIGISRSHFYEQVKRGKIKTICIGGRRLVPDTERARILSGGADNAS